MKNFKFITITLAFFSLLLSPSDLFARKTRSDKGGHHKHHSYHSTSESSHSKNFKSTGIATDTAIFSDTTSIEVNQAALVKEGEKSLKNIFWLFTIAFVCFLPIYIHNKRSKLKNKRDEKTWASEDGKALFAKLATMINRNESIKATDIEELKDLSEITLESVNKKFEVKDPKNYRIKYATEVLDARWKAENEPLTTISEKEALEKYSINLTEGEVLHETFSDCKWYELKRNKPSAYHGVGLRIPLGGGFTYRIGTMTPINVGSKEEYKLVSEGTLYLTSKRIIFQGSTENKTINLNSLIDIELFKDSVILGKTTGKKPIIAFDPTFDDAAIFSRLISRAF